MPVRQTKIQTHGSWKLVLVGMFSLWVLARNFEVARVKAHEISESSEGGQVQAWESVCWGVLGIPLFQIYNFISPFFNFQVWQIRFWDLKSLKNHFRIDKFHISILQVLLQIKNELITFKNFEFRNFNCCKNYNVQEIQIPKAQQLYT